MENEIIETQLAKCWLDESGIGRAEMRPNISSMTMADAQELGDAMKKLSRGKKVYLLADLRQHSSSISNRETREYFVSEEIANILGAVAVLIGSPVNKVIGNFFLRINKPKFPLHLFTIEAEAGEWLKGFMESQ